MRIEPDARLFTLDTGFFFRETYETWRRIEERYGFSIEVYQGIASSARPTSTATSSGSATPTPAAGSARSRR